MTHDCDVLVVGLGPVGATLTALLAKRNLRVIAIDRDTEVYPLPRAAHFDHEIMRLFQQLGIAEAVLAHAQPAPAYEFRTAEGEALLRFDLARRSGISGWPQSFMFHQPGMENALRALIARLPHAETRLGTRLASLAQDKDGVSARVDGLRGEGTMRARYGVGCDGASSAVRETLGIALDTYDFDEPWLVIDTAPGNKKVPDINLQICDPARPTTCVLMGPKRHRWEFMLLPGEHAETVLEEAFIRDLLVPWGCRDIAIERKAVYRFHGLVAKEWRRGRVLLAGDAAHQMPPFAGQGMCSGLRDAANIAWKLAEVLNGARDALLDTYQQEREPHVRATIASAIAMGRVVCTTDPAIAAERDRSMLAAGVRENAPPAPAPFAKGFLHAGSPGAGSLFIQPWAKTSEGEIKLDDVLGGGAWLIARTKPEARLHDADKIALYSLEDTMLAPFAPALQDWLTVNNVEAVFVRPDRTVFGTSSVDELLDTYRAAFGGETRVSPEQPAKFS